MNSFIPNLNSIRMYDGCHVVLRDGTIRGPVSLRTDIEPHMRPWINGAEAWFDNGGYRIQGGESPWDVVRVMPASYPGIEHAIAILEARLPMYVDIGQINAIREAIGCLRSANG